MIVMLMVCVYLGADSRDSARSDRSYSSRWSGAADAVEDGHNHPRPTRVRALREGTHDGQVGYGKYF